MIFAVLVALAASASEPPGVVASHTMGLGSVYVMKVPAVEVDDVSVLEAHDMGDGWWHLDPTAVGTTSVRVPSLHRIEVVRGPIAPEGTPLRLAVGAAELVEVGEEPTYLATGSDGVHATSLGPGVIVLAAREEGRSDVVWRAGGDPELREVEVAGTNPQVPPYVPSVAVKADKARKVRFDHPVLQAVPALDTVTVELSDKPYVTITSTAPGSCVVAIRFADGAPQRFVVHTTR